MPDYTDWSNAELIAACRKQSQGAWNALVQRYGTLVYTIPRRYGLTPQEVDDVFQSVWLLLLQHLDTLEQPERLSAWLVTTAKRETWKLRRGAAYKRTDERSPDSFHDLPAIDQLPPDEIVSQYERQASIRRALEALDPRCRELLSLLYYDRSQPSYAEIADRLGLAIGSIGPIRARCLKRLTQLVEDQSQGRESN